MPHFVLYDHLLLVLVVVLAVLEWQWVYPRFLAAVERKQPGARAGFYATEIITLWALTAFIVGLWIVEKRPWSALLMGTSSPIRLVIGWSLAIAYMVLGLKQYRALVVRPERLQKLMKAMGKGKEILPCTAADRSGFNMLSVTAGICEEFLFRGFLVWYGTQWGGPIVGFLVSTALFGFIHLYLGPRHVPRTAIVGIVFYAIAMTAGSLIPAMLVHAWVDLVSGSLGYRVLGESKGDEAAPAPAS